VPQANLATELRRTSPVGGAAIPEPAPAPDAERTRDALSRYQASRLAAQQQVEQKQRAQKQVSDNIGGGP
jgi:hypothetical protein